jgi:hypothetical protein
LGQVSWYVVIILKLLRTAGRPLLWKQLQWMKFEPGAPPLLFTDYNSVTLVLYIPFQLQVYWTVLVWQYCTVQPPARIPHLVLHCDLASCRHLMCSNNVEWSHGCVTSSVVTERIVSFPRIIFLYSVFGFYEPTASKLIKLRRTALGFCIIGFGGRRFRSWFFILKAEKPVTGAYIGFLGPLCGINSLGTSTTITVFKWVDNSHVSTRLRAFKPRRHQRLFASKPFPA